MLFSLELPFSWGVNPINTRRVPVVLEHGITSSGLVGGPMPERCRTLVDKGSAPSAGRFIHLGGAFTQRGMP